MTAETSPLQSAFHPDHWTDLKKSGLSDSTITMSGVYTVRPCDIPKLLGFDPQKVTSALAFPYPGQDFIRIKVFPTYTDASGHKIKYLQKKGSGVYPYMPPAIGDNLRDTATPLYITEGEKKALRAAQEGLCCVGLGGIWNWKESGDNSPLPQIKNLPLVNRPVHIIPDSDFNQNESVLLAVYRLGLAMERLGAAVDIVCLPPGSDGAKTGLDDFLLYQTRAGFEALERISLKHQIFKTNKTTDSKSRPKLNKYDGAPEIKHFQILGYNQGDYFYLPIGSRQIVQLSAKDHTQLSLFRLAPLEFWDKHYGSKEGIAWGRAASALMSQAERAGIYDTTRSRGRGAWWDVNKPVLHLGDRIVMQDRSIPIHEAPRGAYIYEAASPMVINYDNPLSPKEAHEFADLCAMLTWEKPINANFLAGWCAVAPICGALSWRPHIWLTGGSGAGKSWVLDNIIHKLLGNIRLAVQSETTEAGIRQMLGHDALPIIFDEAEGEDQRAQNRMQNILALARQASSEGGASIIKGTSHGTARSYRIRSCFAFSSIGFSVYHNADSNRITALSLQVDESEERAANFGRIKAKTAELLTEEYARRFLARAIRMIPQIRTNAATFAAAGAAAIGSQRLGDQIGALLAGYYSLHSDGIIDPKKAVDWIAKQDWSDQTAIKDAKDEMACLNRILEHLLDIRTTQPALQRTLGELVRTAGGHHDPDLAKEAANEILARHGIRVDNHGNDDDTFTVSSTHNIIARLLDGSKWHVGWAKALKRLSGAIMTPGTVRFGATKSRGVELPLSLLD